jgi:hypothetical protein
MGLTSTGMEPFPDYLPTLNNYRSHEGIWRSLSGGLLGQF